VYNRFIVDELRREDLDEDVQRSYGVMRKHHEKIVTTLKEKLVKEAQSHRNDTMRIMRENVELLSEINGLRKEYKSLSSVKKQIDYINKSLNASMEEQETAREYQKEIEMQQNEISLLRGRIDEIKQTHPTRVMSTGRNSRNSRSSRRSQNSRGSRARDISLNL
jgi:hypothetical protein